MEAIRYAVIHAGSGVYEGAFDTLEEASRKVADLNSFYGDGLFVSRAMDKREADLKDAAELQLFTRGLHMGILSYMECGDLESACRLQRMCDRDARRAMELMGVIDPA